MKKWMNTLFFCNCFIASLLLYGYAVTVSDGDIITAVGLGMVALITAYLLVDSFRSDLRKMNEDTRSYMNQLVQDQMKQWIENQKEIIDLQKATYTSTKKNKETLIKELEQLTRRMEAFESKNAGVQYKLIELQKKVMEGQKQALNLEIRHNRDNTDQILEELHREQFTATIEEQLHKLLAILENNNQLMKDDISSLEGIEDKKTSEADSSYTEKSESEENEKVDEIKAEIPKITPLYEDPNKALSTDGIAALFASFGQ